MDFYGHIIDGEEVPSLDGATMPDIDPFTREQWATVACGGKADADRAVAAARKAFDEGPWPRMGYEKRQAIMHRLADLMDEHADELAMADTRDMGKPIVQAHHDVARSSWNVRFFADHARMSTSEAYPMDSGHHAYARFDPVGVAVAISPWNFPLMLGTWKVMPALAWGNTVVWKPAEDTPVSATIVGRLALEAGMPPGVLNVVHGYGPDSAGSALTSNPDVERITFTGESGTGKIISAAASRNLVPVSLELGGKGANIVFDDAELDNAVHWAVQAIFRNAGQICLSGSRLYLQAGIYDEFVERFVKAAEALKAGDPKDPGTEFPLALASQEHFDKVSSYLGTIEQDGGRIVTGGLGDGLERQADDHPRRPADGTRVPRGDLRAGVRRPAVRDRGRGRARGQRHPLRAQRDGVHREPVARAPGGGEAQGRHGVGELLLHPRPAGAVRRRRRVRASGARAATSAGSSSPSRRPSSCRSPPSPRTAE